MTLQPSPEHQKDRRPTRRLSLRVALLGTAAAIALGGAYVSNGQGPQAGFILPARADTAATELPAPAGFADIVDKVKGAVVSIKVKVEDTSADSGDDSDNQLPDVPPDSPLYRFFKRFHQEAPDAKPHISLAQGSGFFISADGYIVTNDHVVDNATDVQIIMDDGKTLPAKVVGTDKKTDLALLKVTTGSNYPYVSFAGKTPRVGDWVLAVGNPFGLGGTVTAGIVSARGRDIGSGPYDDFIQIDAPVNRGNSGGPTFNTQGLVVGVNTAIFSPSGGSVGIGFDIPADTVQSVILALKEHGKVTRGWIGVQIQPVTSDIADSLGLKSTDGALVAEVQPNGPAMAAGIKSGDVILSVNGDVVEGPRELARKIASLAPSTKVDIKVWHNGSTSDYMMTLGTLPNDQVAKVEAPTEQETNPLSGFGLALAAATDVPGAGKQGVVVTEVDPDGAAAQKGLKVGDVILEVGGKTVTQPSDVSDVIKDAKKEGRKAVLLRVKSGDDMHYVALSVNPAS